MSSRLMGLEPVLRGMLLLLALLVAGCRTTRPGLAPLEESTREVSEAFSRYREAMRVNDIAQAYRMLSTGAKRRHNLWEYALLMDSNTALGGLLRRLLTRWDVVAISCAQDRKTAWIILRHPGSPQHSKVLGMAWEFD